MKIRPVGAELFEADGRTDGRTDEWTDGHDDVNSRLKPAASLLHCMSHVSYYYTLVYSRVVLRLLSIVPKHCTVRVNQF